MLCGPARVPPSAFRVVRLPPGPASSPSRLAVGVRRRCRWRCTHMQPPPPWTRGAPSMRETTRARRGGRRPPSRLCRRARAPHRFARACQAAQLISHISLHSRTTKRNHTAAPRHGRDSSLRAFFAFYIDRNFLHSLRERSTRLFMPMVAWCDLTSPHTGPRKPDLYTPLQQRPHTS